MTLVWPMHRPQDCDQDLACHRGWVEESHSNSFLKLWGKETVTLDAGKAEQ
jgi:hypothetical protein